MSLKVGIVGLPNVGKSTLFKALTKNPVDIANYPFCTIEPNIGIVKVPDERLEKLAQMSQSAKIVPTIVEFVDIAGLVAGAAQGEGLGNKFLAHIREVDAIAQVVRVFPAQGGSASGRENITHVYNTIDPQRDIEIINTELILADLETVTKRIAKLEKEARGQNKVAVKTLEIIKNIKNTVLNANTARNRPATDCSTGSRADRRPRARRRSSRPPRRSAMSWPSQTPPLTSMSATSRRRSSPCPAR